MFFTFIISFSATDLVQPPVSVSPEERGMTSYVMIARDREEAKRVNERTEGENVNEGKKKENNNEKRKNEDKYLKTSGFG